MPTPAAITAGPLSLGNLAPFWLPKSCKIGDLGHLGGVLGHLGGLLGTSWAVFSHLGPSWRRLGPSWRRLGPSWAHLGGVLGPKLGVLGAKTTQKILPRRPMMPLRCLQDSPRSDFHQKKGKNEPFELGWHFPFDFNPISAQKCIPEY